jgi:hypothetical protein
LLTIDCQSVTEAANGIVQPSHQLREYASRDLRKDPYVAGLRNDSCHMALIEELDTMLSSLQKRGDRPAM